MKTMDPSEFGLKEIIPESVVREQVNRILSDPSFRSSRRYPKFLKFIVDMALRGEAGAIKERLIGIEVFDRPHDYDVANDPVVRLVAGETRKRLAQYYIQQDHAKELRIDLLPGSYVPNIYWPHLSEPPHSVVSEVSHTPEVENDNSTDTHTRTVVTAPEERPFVPVAAVSEASVSPNRSLWSVKTAAAVFLILLTGIALYAWWTASQPTRMLNAFWSPIVGAGSSTLICIGDLNNLMQTAPINDDSLHHSQLTANHVGPYDVGALATITGMLGSKANRFRVLLADNATLTDFRSQPGILIGAFDNQWTTLVLSSSRFQFRSAPTSNLLFIFDSRNPKRMDWVINTNDSLRGIKRDAAIISRISSPVTGQVDVVLAGIGPYGTTAATEFVTNPAYFKQFTRRAPSGWENGNIQIIVRTDVINGRSGPPQMVAFDIQ